MKDNSVTTWFMESLLLMNECVCYEDYISLAASFIQEEGYSFEDLFEILRSNFAGYLETKVQIHPRAPILYQGFDTKLNYLDKLKEENKEVSTLRHRFLEYIGHSEIQNSPLFGLLQEWLLQFNFSIYVEYFGKKEVIGIEHEEIPPTYLFPISVTNMNALLTSSYGEVLALESGYEETSNYEYLTLSQHNFPQDLRLNYMVGQYKGEKEKYFCQFYRRNEKCDFHLFFNYQVQTLENICVLVDGKEDRFTALIESDRKISALYRNKQFPEGQEISLEQALSWVYDSIQKNIPGEEPIYEELEKFLPQIKGSKVKKQTLSN